MVKTVKFNIAANVLIVLPAVVLKNSAYSSHFQQHFAFSVPGVGIAHENQNPDSLVSTPLEGLAHKSLRPGEPSSARSGGLHLAPGRGRAPGTIFFGSPGTAGPP
jgi:hypothetical protein